MCFWPASRAVPASVHRRLLVSRGRKRVVRTVWKAQLESRSASRYARAKGKRVSVMGRPSSRVVEVQEPGTRSPASTHSEHYRSIA